MEENNFQNNKDNNTLSIIDNSISKDKIIENKNLNNNENIPIRHLKKRKINNAEDYYSQNYPEFKLYKCFGILFCRMGNLITFNFDNNINFTPKFSIGPHWFLTLFLNILITTLGGVIFIFIIKTLNFIYHMLFYIFYLMVIFLLNRTALIHPGTEINKINSIHKYCFCDKCKIYYNPDEKVSHCSLCKMCIKKMDHHCVWVGKCVGQNNLFSFYEMILAVGIFYIYIIICVIIFNIKGN